MLDFIQGVWVTRFETHGTWGERAQEDEYFHPNSELDKLCKHKDSQKFGNLLPLVKGLPTHSIIKP